MHQDSFRSVVCRSLSKSLPPRGKDGTSCPETVHCVVTLQPPSRQVQQWSPSQSYRDERSMSLHRDYMLAPSLSKHFADDLLRGAMDLQESLAMLERFQAVSHGWRQSNKKRRPETGERSPEIDTIVREVLLGPSSAKHVPPRTASKGSHEQLRNSTDELKNVVKDSLYRKNLLSVPSNSEQASFSQPTRYSPNNHLTPKTTEQKTVAPKSFPSCVPVQPDKPKSPSLVAKLMGLDGLPAQHDCISKDEKMKTVGLPRAQFDIEIPKSKRQVPRLIGLNSQFDTEMPMSEKPRQEHRNALMNYARSQKGNDHSYGPLLVNEIGSRKLIQKETKTEQDRGKSLKEIKAVLPTSRKQQMKDTTGISKEAREKQKTNLTARNGGRKNLKAKAGPACSNTKIVERPDNKLVESSSSHTHDSMKSNLQLQEAPKHSREKTLSKRNVKSSTVDEIVAYEIQKEIIHALDGIDGPSTEHNATPSNESWRSADWDVESSLDDIRNEFSESYEALISVRHAERIGSADGDTTCPSTDIIPMKEAVIKDEISLLLLSDRSFLSRAAELTGASTYEHLADQYKGILQAEIENRDLYLDTAVEQLELKHRQQNSLFHGGFQGKKRRATAYFSLEALVRDISYGIRKLKGFSFDKETGNTTDSLDMKLERDLWCADAWINSVWDMGWQDWICMEETECFVRDAGEDILSLLIEEAASDMWIH